MPCLYTPSQYNIKTETEGEQVPKSPAMANGEIFNTPATTTMAEKRFRGRRPLPKRGQIKSRIVTTAFISLVGVVLRV